jgi:restriction system protein
VLAHPSNLVLTHTLIPTIVHGAAGFLQYLIPAALLAGAIASALDRYRRRALLSSVATGNTASRGLRQLSWQEFEMVVGEYFRKKGFNVIETGGGGADGGVDLQLRKGGEVFVVQCKQWKATTVPVHVVRDLYGVMAACGAAGGFVVTTGRFTGDAARWANGKGIELIDGNALARRIAVTPQRDGGSPAIRPAKNASQLHRDGPVCPSCGRAMVKRVVRRGPKAGESFFGCSGYPACNGTRAIT